MYTPPYPLPNPRASSSIIAFVRTHPNLRAITGDCKLAAPINFIRGISAGKLDSFRLDFVCVSDERGSVINDYLW